MAYSISKYTKLKSYDKKNLTIFDPPKKKLHNRANTDVVGNSIPFSHHISENAVMDRHNPKAVYMYAINDCSICNMQ